MADSGLEAVADRTAAEAGSAAAEATGLAETEVKVGSDWALAAGRGRLVVPPCRPAAPRRWAGEAAANHHTARCWRRSCGGVGLQCQARLLSVNCWLAAPSRTIVKVRES